MSQDLNTPHRVVVDGNGAAASVAYRCNEVIAIYPITPASPMGEAADAWAAEGRTNIWDTVPTVMEMQSEGGAAGAVHGAIQGGALTTTFTASQGLLLMIPNMFKIAGELSPAVIHVAARSVATHALSIFGDHSDVMAARTTGWAMLASSTVQEAQDLALVAQAATLTSRIPFVHFFDGFRTSHELKMIDTLSDDDIRALISFDDVAPMRDRRLDPDRPVLRGTAQNPDVFFQAREASNPFHDATPGIVADAMDRLATRTGRQYRLFDYVGAPDATEVVVMMGSGVGAASEAVESLNRDGAEVGLVNVHLYRPFAVDAFVAAIPETVRTIAVLDRTKEPGAVGEPLYTDVAAAVLESTRRGTAPWSATAVPRVIGGRYGLSSKEFTPAMARAVFDEAARADPQQGFTIGITDDVTNASLPWDRTWSTESPATTRAVFHALGSDGTVGANKNTMKIVGDNTSLHVQGYFVYDSRKSGARTVSHLRFGPEPIDSTYLITEADFIACHQFDFLERLDILSVARPGATFLLNSPHGPDEVWDHLPAPVQQQIIDKGLRLFVVDGHGVAAEAGLGGRINTVLQTCFFALAELMDPDVSTQAIKAAIEDEYGRFGQAVVDRNITAVDGALDRLHEVTIPTTVTSTVELRDIVPEHAPDFVQRVTARMLAGEGDLLPVSALPVDGTFPTGTTQYERRSIAREIPIFDPEICVECAKCAIVCPHAAIRIKAFTAEAVADAPVTFRTRSYRDKQLGDHLMTVQVAPDDCTGCGVCVDVCPAKSKEQISHRAINMAPKADHLDAERENWAFFTTLPEPDRTKIRLDTTKGSQLIDPLFEFSGACAGCGETPYLKLLTQLFGDRVIVANATGCSSIFGGNLPTTPWRTDANGRGPAWANSLFEDNAEFGLGLRLALDHEEDEARQLVHTLGDVIGDDLRTGLLDAQCHDAAGLAAQRRRVDDLVAILGQVDQQPARRLEVIAGTLVPKTVWLVGGDGWAYDIGFGGLDHALASGRDINILVLDTEVYSNTGGQASKATPRGAVAKFASSGRAIPKKDLGQIAMAYEDVYVAQVAMGANNTQTVKAFVEAESFPGPSLIIAYSSCIAHGIDMATSMTQQKRLTEAGYWPLYRYDPRVTLEGKHAFHIDSRTPTLSFAEVARDEARFAMLTRSSPQVAERLFALAQADIDERWSLYEQFEDLERRIPDELADDEEPDS
ncbi:MAG: pyruvate:ferredoxin (flavodoxin) oxidoreductase [Acidimicrobiales bacterium]